MKINFRRFTNFLIAFVVLVTTLLPSLQPSFSVRAQAQDGIHREYNAETGKVNLITGVNHAPISVLGASAVGVSSETQSLAIVQRFAPEFGLTDPSNELQLSDTNLTTGGRVVTKYQQIYQGIPVIAGELTVNANKAGALVSMNGEVSTGLSLDVTSKFSVEAAIEMAKKGMAKWYGGDANDYTSTQSSLWIFDEKLLRPSTRPVELVWRIEMVPTQKGTPIRELVLVDAKTSNISLHFNQIDTAWKTTTTPAASLATSGSYENSAFYLTLNSPIANTYTAGGLTSLPGSFLCNQSQPNCTNNANPHADAAHKYALGTYNLYATKHLRDSINNNGMTIVSSVHYDSGYANAFWNGTQMVYGDGYGFALADDVVAHELTHGVTDYESNLFYYYQSGAINESFSDVWGEYYDQTNGLGTDTLAYKWLMGEDVGGLGAIRSMSNPPLFGDPDKITSLNYNFDVEMLDNGGVHSNSGINNKAVFLMVDGGTFNSITVSALGWDKVAAIYYEVQSNLLSSGADYSDLYFAVQQACVNLTGQLGITVSNCQQVKNALDAVEMNAQPSDNYNPDAPICAANYFTVPIFQDNVENGASFWQTTGTSQNAWSLTNGYASSATHMLYGDDFYTSNDSSIRMTMGLALPASSEMYLHFKHAFGFESSGVENYDGGVLEYTINNGASWMDASSLFVDGQNYKGVISNYSGTTNVLMGRYAFVGDSHGYVSSRYDLTALGGQTVKFRWRFATDESISTLGWTVDDVQVYRCMPTTFSPTVASSLRVISSPTDAASVKFNVTFSENVTGVSVDDFSLTNTIGQAGATVSGVSGSGSVYTVTVNTGSPNGTIRLDVMDNNSIVDTASNPLGGVTVGDGNFTGGETYLIIKPLAATSKWTGDFSYAQGWRTDLHPRTTGDVNGDGKDDLVGFGYGGIFVSLSNGTQFLPVSKWSGDYSYDQGWRIELHPRMVGDMNGDGKDDVVGYGSGGAWVALSDGSKFLTVTKWTSDFSYAQGWRTDLHPRVVGDMNGDGKDDLIGFGYGGVFVSLSDGTKFLPVSKWSGDYSYDQGWRIELHPRMVGDVNGDLKEDVVGYGSGGVWIAIAQ